MSNGVAATSAVRDLKLVVAGQQQPLELIPTVVVALDEHGRRVCERLASLLRAHVRDVDADRAAAIRERFSFIRLMGDYPRTEVQAISIDPSERLWNIGIDSWSYSAFTTEEPIAFGAALREAIRRVLNYRLVEEDLRERNIHVLPSHLNIFFTGALIPAVPEVVASFQLNPDDGSAFQALSDAVVHELEDIERITMAVCAYADQSASLDRVVRGAFLSLALPEDTFSSIRDVLAPHGVKFGRLLSPRMEGERQGLRGYREPPLHFCSLYANHDEGGAWYDSDQMANTMASAIYALMQSELISNNRCAGQLGLRDPYAGPYDRITTIAAMRSAPPSADLLDYSALNYGAYLLNELLPPAASSINARERMAMRPIIDKLLDQEGLARLVARNNDLLFDRYGLPTQLSVLATNAGYEPPDLWNLIPEPQLSWFTRWSHHVEQTLSRLHHLEQLSTVLDQPWTDDKQVPVQLLRSDGSGSFTYEDEQLLLNWHRWRRSVDDAIDEPKTGEVNRRIAALSTELDRVLWGAVPEGMHLSGSRYCFVMLTLAADTLVDVYQQLEWRRPVAPPTDQDLADELERVRQRSSVRASIAPIIAMALVFFPLLLYLCLAIRDSAANDRLAVFLRRPGWELGTALFGSWHVVISMSVLVAGLGAVVVLILGWLTQHWQTRQALRGLREYAQLIRRRFGIRLYQEEHEQLQRLFQQIMGYREFLQRYLQGLAEGVHGAPERRQAGATQILRERSEGVGRYGFRDLSEYLPMAHGGPIAVYNQHIAPRMAAHVPEDLQRLRRYAREHASFLDVAMSDDPQAIHAATRELINRLVLGDPQATERDPAAGLRFIAYDTLRGDLEELAAQTITQQFLQRARDLQERTHLMLRTGYRPGGAAYSQSYLVASLPDIGEVPDLAETILVRGFDHEAVMYVRVLSGLWPSLFEGGGVVLQ